MVEFKKKDGTEISKELKEDIEDNLWCGIFTQSLLLDDIINSIHKLKIEKKIFNLLDEEQRQRLIHHELTKIKDYKNYKEYEEKATKIIFKWY